MHFHLVAYVFFSCIFLWDGPEEGPGFEDPHGAHQSPVKSLSSVCGAVVREPVLDILEEESDNLGSSSAAAFKSQQTYNRQ